VEAYSKAVGSFDGRVLVSAQKFKELGASTGEEIDGLEEIDTSTRKMGEDNSIEGAFPEGVNKEMVLPAGEE
jgi:DNA recombination protein RmuC